MVNIEIYQTLSTVNNHASLFYSKFYSKIFQKKKKLYFIFKVNIQDSKSDEMSRILNQVLNDQLPEFLKSLNLEQENDVQ